MEALQQTQQQQPQSMATGNTNQLPTSAGGLSSIDSRQTTAQQILALLQQQQQQLQQQQIQLQSLLQQQSLASSAPAASLSSSAASALWLQQEQLQARILDPSVNVDTLQQELDDLTACFALVKRTSELRIPGQDPQTSSDNSPAVPQLQRHILPVSKTAATLSTSMVLPQSFQVRPASASSSLSPSSSSSSATIPPLPRRLPEFNPAKHNTVSFLERFKMILDVHHYPPDLWYLALISQITDPDAFHWAKQTLASDMTWEDIHAEFLDHFTSPEYESKLQDEYHSFKAKPGETVRAIGDHLHSLRDQMVNKLSTPAPHSLDEVINIALVIESDLWDPDQTTPTDDGSKKKKQRPYCKVHKMFGHNTSDCHVLQHRKQPNGSGNTSSSSSSTSSSPSGASSSGPSPATKSKSHITCYNCNQKGHYSNECLLPKKKPPALLNSLDDSTPSPPAQPSGNSLSALHTDDSYEEYNHAINKLQADSLFQLDANNDDSSFDKICVPALINNHLVSAFLDTGASRLFIDLETAKKFHV
ncbi:Zinc finger, CCHC-type [Balamuthia mandrillaris]